MNDVLWSEATVTIEVDSIAQSAEQLTQLLGSTRGDEKGNSYYELVALPADNEVLLKQLLEPAILELGCTLQGYLGETPPEIKADTTAEGKTTLSIPLQLPSNAPGSSLPLLKETVLNFLVNRLCAEWLLLRMPSEVALFMERGNFYLGRMVAVINRRKGGVIRRRCTTL